ncbi:MAG: PadR family transcriptional regulator [Arachnia sp.]
MSVKHALLALLEPGPATAYQLKKAFDSATGDTWPLNLGQVSTTLQRLERDGFIGLSPTAAPGAADTWQLTESGTAAVVAWWRSPVAREPQGRDELVIKLALAVTSPGVDVRALVQLQRTSLQATLHDVTRALRSVARDDLPAHLVLQHHIFAIEAEIRWLDAVEGTLASRPAPTREAAAPRLHAPARP